MYCRAWSCEICQPRRQAQLVAKAKRGLPDTFITLTVNPARCRTPYERARALADAWRKVVKRIKRKYGYKTLPYLCVFEATKKGEPHLHILARCKWIDQAWLSAQMAELIGAPIVDIRRVTTVDSAARYVAKYVGKQPHKFHSCKRYWSTRDYVVVPREVPEDGINFDGTWEILDIPLYLWIEGQEAIGRTVEVGRNHAIAYKEAPP